MAQWTDHSLEYRRERINDTGRLLSSTWPSRMIFGHKTQIPALKSSFLQDTSKAMSLHRLLEPKKI
jgi:hypothetical protein